MRDSNAYLKKSDTFEEKVPSLTQIDYWNSTDGWMRTIFASTAKNSLARGSASHTIKTAMRVSDKKLRLLQFSLYLSPGTFPVFGFRFLESWTGLGVARLVFMLVSLTASQVAVLAQRTISSPVAFEDRIQFAVSNGTCSSWCFQKNCPCRTLTGDATRVVGRGLVQYGDVDANGSLANPEKYIQDGVLDEWATLHVILDPPVGNPDGWGNERSCSPWTVKSTVQINGFGIKERLVVQYCPKSGRDYPQHLTLQFPAKHLRFATRNPGAAPTPMQNTLKILTAATPYQNPAECDDHLGYSIREVYVEFKAMAPVLAIHGCCGESESWFTGTETDSIHGVIDHQNYHPPRISEVFNDRRAAFATMRFSFEPGSNQVYIKEGLPHLVERANRTLMEFGTQSISLLAHSKGGLRARHLIGSAEWQNTGVRSLITIATPHYGSTVAEWVKAQQQSGEHGNNDVAKLIGGLTEFAEREIDELTQEGANAVVNRPFPSPRVVFHIRDKRIETRYWTIGADADRNGNRFLGPDEVVNLGPLHAESLIAGPATLAYRIAGLAKYVYTEKVTELKLVCPTVQSPCRVIAVSVLRAREEPHNEPFRPNDVVVTRRSAAYRLTEAKFYDGQAGQNHHSIGNYWFTGNDVYELLKNVPK